ncbi:transcriptional regulator, partial [Acinetobacter calcoaceticus]
MTNHMSVLQQARLNQVQKLGQRSYITPNEAFIHQYIEQ